MRPIHAFTCLVLSIPAAGQQTPPTPGKAAPLASDADRERPWPLAGITLPQFPPLPEMQQLEPGVLFAEVELVWPRGTGKLWIYLPSLSAAPKSLPCVLVAPAGSNLVFGMSLADGDRPEHLPWVRAGFAVVAYEIEGVMPPEDEQTDENILRQAGRYTAAWGGLQDGRAALEYTLAKVPQVDPKRLGTAGHSSAGTAALLFAAHEPRLRGVAAFMPIGDVVERLADWDKSQMERDLPGFGNFLVRCSPRTHVRLHKQPVFVFAAEDDGNVPIATTRAFVAALQQAGKDVTFETVPEGNHYQPMLDPGIPHAIAWMQQRLAEPAKGGKQPR